MHLYGGELCLLGIPKMSESNIYTILSLFYNDIIIKTYMCHMCNTCVCNCLKVGQSITWIVIFFIGCLEIMALFPNTYNFSIKMLKDI